jgi:hypothetical protein
MRKKTDHVTESETLLTLTFVGGPFDGFEEAVGPDEDLPDCIALPMNDKAEQIFGIQFSNHEVPRVAVYTLCGLGGTTAYHFRGMRRI